MCSNQSFSHLTADHFHQTRNRPLWLAYFEKAICVSWFYCIKFLKAPISACRSCWMLDVPCDEAIQIPVNCSVMYFFLKANIDANIICIFITRQVHNLPTAKDDNTIRSIPISGQHFTFYTFLVYIRSMLAPPQRKYASFRCKKFRIRCWMHRKKKKKIEVSCSLYITTEIFDN